MRTTRPFLAGVTVTICFAGIALAQEPPSDGEAPPPGDEPQAYPPPNEAPPPGYAPPQPQQPVDNAPMPPLGTDARMGGVGQIAISDDLQIAIRSQSASFMGASTSATTYQLEPAIDYFVAPSFSIGASVSLVHSSTDAQSETNIGLMPRVGYDFSLSPLMSIWPRVGLGYAHTSNGFNGSPDTTGYSVTFKVFVPVVFHPAPHFFIGGGPYLSTALVSKIEGNDASKLTDDGLISMLGGYFGGM
jgi:hypothetical protein